MYPKIARFLAVLSILVVGYAHAAIRVTPEQPLTDPVPALSEGLQSPFTIATDGDQFLVFWGSNFAGAYGGVNVALFAADGRRRSSHFFPDPKNQISGVSACWTGTVYFAEWCDLGARTISTATFSRNGELLQGPTVVLQGPELAGGTLAWNGSRSLVLYTSNRAMKGALFDSAGSLIKAGIPMPAIGGGPLVAFPKLTSDGNEFAAVWPTLDYVPDAILGRRPVGNFHLQRITADGDIDGARVDIERAGGATGFGLAYGRGLYAITAIAGSQLVRFAIDAHRGSVTQLPAVNVVGNAASLFWSGNRFVAYWAQYKQGGVGADVPFALKTLAFSGSAEDKAPEPVTSVVFDRLVARVMMASNGGYVFAAWSPESPLYGTLLNADTMAAATADPPYLISMGWSRQFLPSIATSGTESLVVWIEESGDPYSGSGRLLGTRVSASGVVEDVTPFEIATSASTFRGEPAVVFDGTAYLVAWVEGSWEAPTVNVRRVGRDTMLGPPLSLGSGSNVSAASNGMTTLVVFSAAHVMGYRFALGQLVDGRPIVISERDGFAPRVASNGTDFFVAWNEGTDVGQITPLGPPPPDMIDVFGARVSAAGAVDSASLPIALGLDDQILAGVASDGRDYLVSYVEPHNGFLAAKHILREGNLDGATAADDGTIIAREVADAEGFDAVLRYGALSGDASGYWAAFGLMNGIAAIVRTDVHGAPRSGPMTLGTPSSYALAQIPGGPVWIAYARRVDDSAFAGTSRVFVRSAGEGPSLPRARAAGH